jgi:hypothetical protein
MVTEVHAVVSTGWVGTSILHPWRGEAERR